MKTILIRGLVLGSFFCFLLSYLSAQDADLYNQAQVNAFNDSIVPGTVHINGSDITDLTPLLKLKSAGNLRIRNTRLSNLAGLDSLKSIGGKLEIEDNNDLTNIDALSNLESINKLEMSGNRNLTNLDGLGGLSGSIDTIYLYRTDLSQIDSLMGLAGDLKLLDIRQNELINLDGLIGITGADKMIIHESKILSIDGLYSMRESRIVDLRLGDLFSLSALAQLNVSESISLRCPIQRLDAFYPVRSLESLTISNCDFLTNFSGLDSLKHVDHLQLHDLMVYTTDILDFSALNQLSGSIMDVSISEVKDLEDLSILDDVESIGSLSLQGNRNLKNLVGIDSLKNLDELSIIGCENMSSLEGFPLAEDSLALLFLSDLPALTSLEGLENIAKLDESYSFKAKVNLERLGILNVDGLSGLSGRYGGFLKIIHNDHLQNLDGLGGISEIGYGIHVEDNPVLDSCCVLKDLLQDLEFTRILENRPSCSRNEIIKADGVCYGGTLNDPDPTTIPEQFAVLGLYPNPTSGQAKIYYASPEVRTIELRIVDLQGRWAKPIQSFSAIAGYGELSLDLSQLNPGLYFVQMLVPETGQIWKLVLY
ncbi:MAG: T9SS type A sorting domain-containing protein [Bacteroidia bacterium]